MQTVIMAGGKGMRVASVNKNIPKPMLSIAGKPILLHQVDWLKRQGIFDITLVIGHLGSQIQGFLGNGQQFGVQITYVSEKMPLVTADAFYYIKDRFTDDFLLINGDLIFDVDFERIIMVRPEKIDLDRETLKPVLSSGKVCACRTPEYVKDMQRKHRYTCVRRGSIAPRFR